MLYVPFIPFAMVDDDGMSRAYPQAGTKGMLMGSRDGRHLCSVRVTRKITRLTHNLLLMTAIFHKPDLGNVGISLVPDVLGVAPMLSQPRLAGDRLKSLASSWRAVGPPYNDCCICNQDSGKYG